jgi:hypothetical protein
MKIKHQLLALSLMTGIAPTVNAQSTTGLDLGGTITPAACALTLDSGGGVDYGTINKRNLNALSPTTLGEKPITLTVACTGATRFAFRFIDNRFDSFVGIMPPDFNKEFGLGKTQSNQNIGGYQIHIDTTQINIDGSGGYSTDSFNSGSTWAASVTLDGAVAVLQVRPAGLHGFTKTSGHTSGPDLLTNMTMPLEVLVVVRRTDQLPGTDDIALDGSSTIELLYL